MKKLLLTMLLATILCTAFTQSSGNLNVTVTTSDAGGNYAPRHVVAVWIEDGQGNFVKTLLAYAANRITHLNTWQAATNNAGSEFNTVDAITGATQNSHATRSCSWDGTDFLGNDMPDGDYHVWMELTDKNSTGNFSSFTFTKGAENITLTPDNAPSFSSIVLVWTADQTGLIDNHNHNASIFPNPGHGIFQLSDLSVDKVTVYNLAGKIVQIQYGNQIDISSQPDGIYLVNIDSHFATLKYIKSK
jgi:hypothetical protein